MQSWKPVSGDCRPDFEVSLSQGSWPWSSHLLHGVVGSAKRDGSSLFTELWVALSNAIYLTVLCQELNKGRVFSSLPTAVHTSPMRCKQRKELKVTAKLLITFPLETCQGREEFKDLFSQMVHVLLCLKSRWSPASLVIHDACWWEE